MELEHNQLELANAEEMSAFGGETYEEHVSTWLEVDRSMQDHYWALGAIADSLEKKHGDDVDGKFASDVGCSKQRIRELRKTHQRWQSAERSALLSFHHHTIAGRAKEPQKAIETAEDEKLSTRELETYVKTGELPERDERLNEPVIEEGVADVEEMEPGPDDIVEIIRAGSMQFVVRFGNGDRHTVPRDILLKSGYKKCSCCGHGVVAPSKGEK